VDGPERPHPDQLSLPIGERSPRQFEWQSWRLAAGRPTLSRGMKMRLSMLVAVCERTVEPIDAALTAPAQQHRPRNTTSRCSGSEPEGAAPSQPVRLSEPAELPAEAHRLPFTTFVTSPVHKGATIVCLPVGYGHGAVSDQELGTGGFRKRHRAAGDRSALSSRGLRAVPGRVASRARATAGNPGSRRCCTLLARDAARNAEAGIAAAAAFLPSRSALSHLLVNLLDTAPDLISGHATSIAQSPATKRPSR